jgi:ribosomal protein L11 methyltransferase
VDNDPQALTATRNNAEHNKVGERIHTFMPEDMPAISADVIVANILAGPLAQLSPNLAGHSRKGTQIALSGIIRPQVDELREVYAQWFDMDGLAIREEDWCRLSGTRRD